MSAVIPFESANLPANISKLFKVSNDLTSGGGGFPVISIKGKVFTVKRGDEKTIITKPDAPDEPSSSIEVVILKAFPGAGKTAKVYYQSGYTEGSDASPTCYSNDGVVPADDSEVKQSHACATCKHSQWGSKITENNAKGKACADIKRLAVAPVNQINDPMLLRVPAASLKPLSQFNDVLAKRGVPYQAVVTKISFDYTVAHPALTFKAVSFLNDETLVKVANEMESDLVNQIAGVVETFDGKAVQGANDVTSAVAETANEAKPEVKPPPASDDLPKTKRATVKVEAAKPANVVEAESGLAVALDEIQFDD